MEDLNHPGADLFGIHGQGRTFINAAYMSPKPVVALDAMESTLRRMASPDFGADEFFNPLERIRELLARVVGGQPGSFSLTGSASFGMAILAWNLRTDADALVGGRRRILGVDGQFPSNVQTWKRLLEHGFELILVPGGAGATERLIQQIDGRTALVAVAPLSWTDGVRLDVDLICQIAARAGALSLLDVTQSAGVDKVIDADHPVDLVVGAGYKWLLGPYGTGFIRMKSELQERLEPLEANWKNFEGSSDFNRLNEYSDGWASLAAKFDHGESSAFVRLAGWQAGLETILNLGLESISDHATDFARTVAEGLDQSRFEMSLLESGRQANHLFRVAPRDSSSFEELSASLEAASISVSLRNGGWRLSPHVYNGGRDVERFLEVLC